MTKGLFTSTEEIYYEAIVKGHISPIKNSPLSGREIRQENRCVSQNVKRLNLNKRQIHIRAR